MCGFSEAPLVIDERGIESLGGSEEVGVPFSLGTSRLIRAAAFWAAPLGCREWSVVAVGDAIGKRVSGPPELRSLRWPRGEGAGLVALPRLLVAAAMARARCSMATLRLLSSLLTARGRVSTLMLWVRDEARFSSLNIATLWAKRSRIRR